MIFLLSHNNIVKKVSKLVGILNFSGAKSSGCGGHSKLSSF